MVRINLEIVEEKDSLDVRLAYNAEQGTVDERKLGATYYSIVLKVVEQISTLATGPFSEESDAAKTLQMQKDIYRAGLDKDNDLPPAA